MRIEFCPAYRLRCQIGHSRVKTINLSENPFYDPTAKEQDDRHQCVYHHRRFHQVFAGNCGEGLMLIAIPLGDLPDQIMQASSPLTLLFLVITTVDVVLCSLTK